MMARRRTGDKPLSVPVLTRFADVYMRHQGENSFNCQWHVNGTSMNKLEAYLEWNVIFYILFGIILTVHLGSF